ncbi:MAG: hypothetical protein ACLRT5_10900 [Lachnospiraceae bacterium]
MQAIADYYGLTKEQVFVGVGSDDVLAMIFLTFFNSPKPIPLSGYHPFLFHDVWASMLADLLRNGAAGEDLHDPPGGLLGGKTAA